MKDELRRRKEEMLLGIGVSSERMNGALSDMSSIAGESIRVADIAHNAISIIENLDEEFESQTGLTKPDVAFMFFATALQCARWALLTKFKERVDHDKTEGGKTDEHSNRSHRWYRPSLEEVISNPVPFDTTFGSPDTGANIGGKHRLKTLGHDPVLGWVFGTANIATSTLTRWDFTSYHIKTGEDKLGRKKDKLTNRAKTELVFDYTGRKLLDEGAKGKSIIGASLVKEYAHLKSDIGSHKSLPFPLVSSVSPQLADTLADYGLDMANVLTVGKQAAYSTLINALIGMIHYLFYDPIKDNSRRLYEVRTRKIITYSNLISSNCNVLAVAVKAALGDAEGALRMLDIGGFLVALYRLISDAKFIKEVKQEFVMGNYYKLIQGESLK